MKKETEYIPERYNPAELLVTIDPLVYAKIRYWMDKAKDLEVSGFGKVLRMAGRLHVCDAFLLQQENSGTSTDIDAASIAKMHFLKREEPGDMNFWWHSHNNMSAYFSQTDHDNIKLFGQHGWLLSTVLNHKGETQTSLYINHPTEIYLDDLDMQVCRFGLTDAVKEVLDAEYAVNCKEKKYAGYNGTLLGDLDDGHFAGSIYSGLPSWADAPKGGDKDQWDDWFERLEMEYAEREAINDQINTDVSHEQRLLMSANAPKVDEPKKMSKKQVRRFRAAQTRARIGAFAGGGGGGAKNSTGGRRLVWDKDAGAFVGV